MTPLDRTIDAWQEKYDLTPSEKKLLADACTESFALSPIGMAELAQGRGVALSTVKKQANTLLAKTGDKSLLAAAVRVLREAYELASSQPHARPRLGLG